MKNLVIFILMLIGFYSCQEDIEDTINPIINAEVFSSHFGENIDPNNLLNYESQQIPNYIDRDNTNGNEINNEIATLGRVLFYDTNLSSDQSISCASCHQQALAFGDADVLSQGVNGETARHSMRLVNARFGNEDNFFWDERARSLEEQTTMPIRDHVEMGFSGQDGAPSFDDLIERLSDIEYYQELFSLSFGDENITESRMQLALAQFIRSIQSFDSKFDLGLEQENNLNQDFPNFTEQENLGKQLFLRDPQFQNQNGVRIGGGFGCQDCHQAPEFSIRNNSGNNGVIQDPLGGIDLTVTRSPSLRDLFDPQGNLNGPMMHTGSFETMEEVLLHYDQVSNNPNQGLDQRLARGGGLNMTEEEIAAVVAFMKTLSGTDVYQNDKWSNPFIQ